MSTHDSSDHLSHQSSPNKLDNKFVEVQSFTTASDWFKAQDQFRARMFLALNAWLAFHLFSIIIFPASVDPSSPLIQGCSDSIAWYLQLLFLDHGFDFFSPDPGSSTLVSYTIEFQDGSTRTGEFPNRTIYPRLYYHRHFMLSEFLGNGPEEARPIIERSFARNLCRENGAVRVTLTKIDHELATVDDVLAGRTLNDPSLFKKTPLGTYTVEELRVPFKRNSEESKSDDAGSFDLVDIPKETP